MPTLLFSKAISNGMASFFQHGLWSAYVKKSMVVGACLAMVATTVPTAASAQTDYNSSYKTGYTSSNALHILSVRFDQSGFDETSLEVLRRQRFETSKNYPIRPINTKPINIDAADFIKPNGIEQSGAINLIGFTEDIAVLRKTNFNKSLQPLESFSLVSAKVLMDPKASFKIDPALYVYKPQDFSQKHQTTANSLDGKANVFSARSDNTTLTKDVMSNSNVEALLP